MKLTNNEDSQRKDLNKAFFEDLREEEAKVESEKLYFFLEAYCVI